MGRTWRKMRGKTEDDEEEESESKNNEGGERGIRRRRREGVRWRWVGEIVRCRRYSLKA